MYLPVMLQLGSYAVIVQGTFGKVACHVTVLYCILFQFRKSNTLSVITFEDIELVMFYNYTIFYPQMKILITTECMRWQY
jgi:hypothetical protein